MTSLIRAKRIAFCALGVAAVAAFSALPARASFDLGDAATFAIYGSGATTSDQLTPGPLTVNGNVGVGAGGDVSLAGGQNVVITGQIMYSLAITTSNWGPITHDGVISIHGQDLNIDNSTEAADIAAGLAANQLVQNNPSAAGASGAIASLYAAVEGLPTTAGAPSGDLTGDFSWSGSTGNNVATLHSLNLGNGDVLTLTGDANTYFIFNIQHGFQVSGTAQIALGANVNPDHVLFNMLKTTDGGGTEQVTVNGTSIGFGTILALDRDVTFNSDTGKTSTWTGRVFGDDSGKTISFGQAVVLNQPGFVGPVGQTPEPSSVILLLTAMLFGLWTSRSRSRVERSTRRQPSFLPA